MAGATSSQIATYLSNIQDAQVVYLDSVIIKERLGNPDIVTYRTLVSVLNAYVDIITEYFSQATYSGGYFITDYNFYDIEEAEDVMLRINKICDTNYYLDLD